MLNFRLESADLTGTLGTYDGLDFAFVDIGFEDLTTSIEDREQFVAGAIIWSDWDSNLASFPLKSLMVDFRF